MNMGTWGVAISSNDFYEDIRDQFLELYNNDIDISEIKSQLLKENNNILEKDEDSNNFWFALAFCLWDCKALDDDVYNKVKEIIESGSDLRLWRDLDSSKADLKKRENKLKDFLFKLSKEKPKARKRKRKRIKLYNAIFEKNECIVFKLNNGNYGGAIILESEKRTEFGLNLVAVTDINFEDEPSLSDIKKANILTRRIEDYPGKFEDDPIVGWFYADNYKKSKVECKKIGYLSVRNRFYGKNDSQSCMPSWDFLLDIFEGHEETIQKNGLPKKIMKVKKLLKISLFR